MNEFFTSIYCTPFEDFIGEGLSNYLYDAGSFQHVGLSMFAITAFAVILFYYMINHPRLCNWWGWAIFLGSNALINFIVGWQWIQNHFYDGRIEDYLTNSDYTIDEGDILCFGVANMLLSIVVFIIFSYLIKWWSTNCSKAPF